MEFINFPLACFHGPNARSELYSENDEDVKKKEIYLGSLMKRDSVLLLTLLELKSLLSCNGSYGKKY